MLGWGSFGSLGPRGRGGARFRHLAEVAAAWTQYGDLGSIFKVVVVVVLRDAPPPATVVDLAEPALVYFGFSDLGLGETPVSRCPRLATATTVGAVPSLEGFFGPNPTPSPSCSGKPLVYPTDQAAATRHRSLLGGTVLLLKKSRWRGLGRCRLLLWVWASKVQCTPSTTPSLQVRWSVLLWVWASGVQCTPGQQCTSPIPPRSCCPLADFLLAQRVGYIGLCCP